MEKHEEARNPYAVVKREPVDSAMTMAARDRAVNELQAAYVVAKKFRREPAEAMDQILSDCTLQVLAEEATYEYSRGGKSIIGASIRLAEAIMRRWGNMEAGVEELVRHPATENSPGWSECRSYAIDLESGTRDVKTFHVSHIRDRSEERGGNIALTAERDIYEHIANMGARRKRACILALIPPDVVENAIIQCEKALRDNMAVDQALIDNLLEAFGKYKVTKDMIEKRIQRRMTPENLTAQQARQLKRIYNSLEQGMSGVDDWFKGAATEIAEDKTKHGRKRVKAKARDAAPEHQPSKEELTKLASPQELSIIRQKAKSVTVTEPEICKAFQMEKLEDMRSVIVPMVLKWLSTPGEKPQQTNKL